MKAFALGLTAGLVAGLFASPTAAQTPATEPLVSELQAEQPSGAAMTSAEIQALFEREARAAYAMNKKTCDGLLPEDKKICLARARLQFDADMRYAQKRAAQGY